MKCRSCGAPVERTFCDLGATPLANSYLDPTAAAIREERHFPLRARVCDVCLLVQLPPFEPPSEIFREYAYFSSYSHSWLAHSRQYADEMTDRLRLDGNSLVVEAASNDGYLLQFFVRQGIPVLGIEPAANVAAEARERGVRTEVQFFGATTARALRAEYGSADLFVANNVIAHVPDLHDFISGIEIALAPDGVATIEFPHLLQLVEDGLYDTIYHEHFSYFSLHSLERALNVHGFAVVDLAVLPTHGGSLRLFLRRGSGSPSSAVAAFRERERDGGLIDIETYGAFQRRAESKRERTLEFVRQAQDRGVRLACYGAPAKGNTLLNFCGLTARDIPYTVDKNPHKQGKLLPGSHIPISPPQRLREDRADTVVILPWNLRLEIAEEAAFVRAWGGRFAVLMPCVETFT